MSFATGITVYHMPITRLSLDIGHDGLSPDIQQLTTGSGHIGQYFLPDMRIEIDIAYPSAFQCLIASVTSYE